MEINNNKTINIRKYYTTQSMCYHLTVDILTIFLIALGLSLDATAVSIAYGAIITKDKFLNAIKFCTSFGFSQMAMPIIGWLAGIKLVGFFSRIDHWIAFGLLLVIGIKMIIESFMLEEQKKICTVSFNTLMGLSIATSIDALAVGLSFGILKIEIFYSILIIGITTFFMSLLGFFIGEKIGCMFKNQIERVAGIILIIIGLKILIEHIL